jgi:DNA-binding response OmpR family regulator
MNKNQRIQIVDSDPATCEFLSLALSDEGYITHSTTDCKAAIDQGKAFQPQLLIWDTWIRNYDREPFLTVYHCHVGVTVSVIALTTEARDIEAILASGVCACLLKPFDLLDLLECVERYLPVES